VVSTGGDRFRRALYTFVRRTSPYPMVTTFDGPSREFCSVKRARTNTPMQALFGLNDPGSFELAQGLALRLLGTAEGDSARLARGFRLCTGRAPEAQELGVLEKALAAERTHFKQNAAAAKQAATTVLAVPPPVRAMGDAEIAAWTLVANALLNLDETITRE
jgi:hypothetical protein